MYEGYHYGGMHLIWWIIWVIVMFWIFATPYRIPGAKKRANGPLDILQKRYAGGSITKEEYEELKSNLMKDGAE